MRKTIGKKILLWREKGWVLQKGHLIMTSQAQKALGDVNNSAAIREKETFGKCQSVDTKLYSTVQHLHPPQPSLLMMGSKQKHHQFSEYPQLR